MLEQALKGKAKTMSDFEERLSRLDAQINRMERILERMESAPADYRFTVKRGKDDLIEYVDASPVD